VCSTYLHTRVAVLSYFEGQQVVQVGGWLGSQSRCLICLPLTMNPGELIAHRFQPSAPLPPLPWLCHLPCCPITSTPCSHQSPVYNHTIPFLHYS